MKAERQIFFDLDHTLWDFDANSKETLEEILVEFQPRIGKPVQAEEFLPHFRYIHKELWRLYQRDEIDAHDIRYRRFRYAFEQMNIVHESFVDEFGHAYMERCPTKGRLVKGASEILASLHACYPLHIISNGFAAAQNTKMETSGIRHYFSTITTSDSAGVKKPHPAIFAHALTVSGCDPENAVYIGDDYEVDVIGGCKAGLNTIFFNPGREPNPLRVPEVKSLSELSNLLPRGEG